MINTITDKLFFAINFILIIDLLVMESTEDLEFHIMDAIETIRNKRKKRPTTESIFNFIKDNEENIDVSEYKYVFEELLRSGRIKVIGEGSNESVFITNKVVGYNKSLNEQILFKKNNWTINRKPLKVY